ncbi:MAG: antitermination protein NusG [Pirellulales bacterium]
MPLLGREIDLYPESLLISAQATEQPWWALYTLARQEKKLMRMLVDQQIGFYAPVIPRRYRSPAGRIRTSYEPLFTNYVFLCGDEMARYAAVSTGCVSRWMPVGQPLDLVEDLRQVQSLVAMDAPLSPERRLEPGMKVRVRTGPFAGYEGVVFRRDRETRLLVAVRFMDQGVSVAIEDCQADPI